MDYYDQDRKAVLKPSHTNVPGVGLVPTGPRASRGYRPKVKRGRDEFDYERRSSTEEVKRGRRESFRNSVRRPSPVPDRLSAKRQDSMSSFSIKREDGKAHQGYNTPQGSGHRLSFSEGTTRGRASVKIEHLSPERNESPGLFVPQDDSDREPNDGDKEPNDGESDSLGNNSEDGSIGNDAVGDFEVGSGDSDTGDDTSVLEVAGACHCPISLQCEKRADHLIDCRSLVPVLEWTRWGQRALHEFDTQLGAAVPPICAPFTTAERVNLMHGYCDRVKRHPEAHPSDRSDYKRMIAWAAEMHTHSITLSILTATQILPRLQVFLAPPGGPHYHQQKRTPMNLLEELQVIFRQWSKGDLLADVNRGIIREIVQTTTGPRQVERLDRSWPHRIRDSFYGHGHLVNGQRWFSRLQMSRDGAHGAPQAGICGRKELGARSIVMGLHDEKQGRFYADVDKGETIWYIGTARDALKIVDDPEPKETNVKDTEASRNREHRYPTDATQALMKSRRTGTPVRVFRSYRLAPIVSHRPQEGFRYDGLYRVVGWECLKKDRQIYRFKMRRLRRNDPASGGQGALRGNRPRA